MTPRVIDADGHVLEPADTWLKYLDPHYRDRQMIIDVPVAGLGVLPQPGVVPKLSLTPGRVTHAGGALGSHTDEILSHLLGMSGDEIAQLRSDRVV